MFAANLSGFQHYYWGFLMKNIVVVTLLAISSLVIVGCEKEGEAEKAGKAIDDAFQDAKEKMEE